MLKSKISIGTANFEKGYGINNSSGFSEKKILQLIKFIKKNKIYSIDTAIAYKSVEKKLGKTNLVKFKLYTKIPKLPKRCKNLKNWLNKSINKSLIDLNIKSFEGIFIHNISDLLNHKYNNELYDYLINLKRKGIAKKIGVSIYDFGNFFRVLEKFKFDIVQLPFNIFDRRLLLNNNIKRIKEKKMEIHVRSVFLQGLLLQDYVKIPKYLKKQKNIFKIWEQWCLKNNLTKIQTCLNFVTSFRDIDKIIVGINSINDLEEISNCLVKKKIRYPNQIYSNNLSLIDPRKWRIT